MTMRIRRVKIYGAGSIGNHLAHASRRLGASVVVVDVNREALRRMKDEVYPGRYGGWDEGIELCLKEEQPVGGFDLICIGTPPEFHIPLASEALKEAPGAIQIEKPLCTPALHGARELKEIAQKSGIGVFVGYDHVVGRAIRKLEEVLATGVLGRVSTLDVEFREHWGGIFRAHPWLKGPEDSYLGFSDAGGGASGEHSHATNLWQHLAHVSGNGRVIEVDAMLSYERTGRAIYDAICLLNLRTESGLTGRVVQDVFTEPARKWAMIQGTEAALEWHNAYSPGSDAVILRKPGRSAEIITIPKQRPDDFIEELKHIDSHMTCSVQSPISLERGLQTMLVVAAAHASEKHKRRVNIEYAAGYVSDALSIA